MDGLGTGYGDVVEGDELGEHAMLMGSGRGCRKRRRALESERDRAQYTR